MLPYFSNLFSMCWLGSKLRLVISLMKIQAGECEDFSGFGAWGEQREAFPSSSNYAQPSSFSGPFGPSFAFGSSWPWLGCSSCVLCSQHVVSCNQTSALAWLLTPPGLACTSANLSDVIRAGALNASYGGQMWHLDVIDKLQLSLWGVWWI